MIYFAKIEGTGNVKIGKSINVIQRKKEIQREIGRNVSIVRVIEGGLKEEREIHERYKGQRIEREIFVWSEEMMEIGQEANIGEEFRPLRIPASIHKKIKIIAIRRSETIQSIATRILREYVENETIDVDND